MGGLPDTESSTVSSTEVVPVTEATLESIVEATEIEATPIEIIGKALEDSIEVETTLLSPEAYERSDDDGTTEVEIGVENDSDIEEIRAIPAETIGNNDSLFEAVTQAHEGVENQEVEPQSTTTASPDLSFESDVLAEAPSFLEEAIVADDNYTASPTGNISEGEAEALALPVVLEALPETSLNEEVDEQADSEAAKDEDFNSLTRRDLIKRLQDIGQKDRISDPLLRKIKAAYDEQFEQERTSALTAFVTDGGLEEDFEFRKDPEAIEFEQLFKLVREKRKAQLEDIDKTKRINLKQKQQLFEDLKALNDQEESNGSLEEIRRIMDKWRSIGPVPHTDAQELFKNFDFQVDKFYSRRTEFFEMKELDRKRNLERKTALLERAKKTLENEVFVNGLREYNKLYEEFRHTGPAPRDENERLYSEIKAIGTQLHEKKKTYDEAQRAEAERIASIRTGLLTQMDVVAGVVSDTIAEWQTQTDLVQKLIAEWKSAGSRFRDQDPEVSRRFWAGLKRFYAAKDTFFKKLDKERADNLARKKEILATVQELVTSENKFKAQSELNQLVTEWKDVGPVAFKDRDKINKEFSRILDTFYDAKRNSVSAEQTEQRDNLAKKQALVDRLVALASEKKGDEAELKEIQVEFNAVGFVPFKKKDEINAAFKEAYTKAIDQSSEIEQGQKAYVKLDSLRGGGGRGGAGRSFGPPIRKENMGQRGVLNKRIAGLENDVRNYRNNMDFIAATKNGEKLKAEFNDRIAKAEEEINLLRTQLKVVEQAGEGKA